MEIVLHVGAVFLIVLIAFAGARILLCIMEPSKRSLVELLGIVVMASGLLGLTIRALNGWQYLAG